MTENRTLNSYSSWGAHSYSFWGARGGHGTTTTAILATVAMARKRENFRISLTDLAQNGGFHAPLGESEGSSPTWEPEVSKTRGQVPWITVFDCGVFRPGESNLAAVGRNFLVLRGPDYTGIRTIIQYDQPLPEMFDGLVVIHETGRALSVRDVADITNFPEGKIHALPYDMAIARTVDAGLLTRRTPTAAVRNLGGL